MGFLFRINFILVFLVIAGRSFAHAELEVPSQFSSSNASIVLGLHHLESLTARDVRSAARALFHKYNPERLRSPKYSDVDRDRAREVIKVIHSARAALLSQKLNPFWKGISTESHAETITLRYSPLGDSSNGKTTDVPKNESHLLREESGLRVLEYAIRFDSALIGPAEKRNFETAFHFALWTAPGNFIAVPASGDRLDFLIDVSDTERSSSSLVDPRHLGVIFYEAEAQSLLSFQAGNEMMIIRLLWDRLNYERRGSRLILRSDAFVRTAATLAHEIHGKLGSLLENQNGRLQWMNPAEVSGREQVDLEIRSYESGVKALSRMRDIVFQIPEKEMREKLQTDLEIAVGREKTGLFFWKQQRAQLVSEKAIRDLERKLDRGFAQPCSFF